MSDEDICQIEAYVEAVSKRKSINKKMSGYTVNMAILLQLENSDIPLLLQIICAQHDALKKVIDLIPDDEKMKNADDDAWQMIVGHMGVTAAEAHIKAEDLARSGSCAKWGEYDDDDNASVH